MKAYIIKIINGITKPIRYNIVIFVFLYVLECMTMLLECWLLNFKIQRYNFFSNILDVYVLCMIITIMPQKIKGVVKWGIAIVLYVLSAVELFCVQKFSARITPEIVNVVLETNSRESSEFIYQYINWGIFISGVGAVFLLMLLHISVSHYYIELKSYIQKILSPLFLLVVKVSVSVLVILSIVLCLKSRIQLASLMSVSTVEETDKYISNFSENTPFNNLLFSLKMHQLSNAGMNDLISTQYSATIDSCNYVSDKMILIIGESYIKCHSQLYGYHLPTTPRQVYRRDHPGKEGQLIAFSDVISPSNLTSIVFKNMFSLYSMDTNEKWSDFPLFPVLLRKAGYTVTFITNQFVPALNTDIFNVSGGLFLNEPRLSATQFSHRNTKTHQFDISLLEDYDSLKAINSEHQFVIFHLAGQHIYFSKRYPSNMRKFSISDYSERSQLDNDAKQLVADYDNATYYNDFVVDSIVRRFEKEDAIVIYVPDHGEECYDELQRIGRLPANVFSQEVLRQEYRIPFWIWCSESFIRNHPTIYEKILGAKSRPFMTDDLPHLILYLAGIYCKEYNEERNLISDKFNSKRKRLIGKKVDYDRIVGKSCE